MKLAYYPFFLAVLLFIGSSCKKEQHSFDTSVLTDGIWLAAEGMSSVSDYPCLLKFNTDGSLSIYVKRGTTNRTGSGSCAFL